MFSFWRTLLLAILSLFNLCPAADVPGSPTQWGAPWDLTPPSDLRNPIQLAVTGYTYYALQADGRVRLMNPVYYPDLHPPASATNIVKISAGGDHVLALRSDRTLLCWGTSTPDVMTPPEGLTDVIDISAGMNHSLALKADGTVVAWGSVVARDQGALAVPAGLRNVVRISAGQHFSMALDANGYTRAWGRTDSYGYFNASSVRDIAVGMFGQYLLLHSNGYAAAYQGANRPPNTIPQPGQVSGVAKIRAGWGQLAAIKTDGSVVMWGANEAGEAIVPHFARNIVDIGCAYVVTVALSRAPMILAERQTISVLAGDPLEVNAIPVADDDYQVQWYKDSGPVLGQPSLRLSIPNPQAADAGNYLVTIANQFGSASRPVATVTVIPSAPRILSAGPLNATIQPGESITLNARVAGTEPISYEWRRYRSGAADRTIAITPNHTIPFDFPDFGSDVLTYELIARNALGTTRSGPLRVMVSGAGYFHQPQLLPGAASIIMPLRVEPNLNYRLEVSDDLSTWNPLLEFRATSQTITLGDQVQAALGRRFFRLSYTESAP